MSEVISPAWAAQFRKLAVRWYKQNHRRLPWRETSDAYAIWISEVMLQQTQVATVIDYYHRFLRRFPDVASLAAAEEQEVLHLWAGLGYYRRARQLHAAAKVIVSDYGGKFPSQLDEILSLPGIGRYTAGAIASFAYGTRAPILEANTIRLFGRLIALRQDYKSSDSQKKLWSFAESILPKRAGGQVGLVNQASMELGSTICLPKQPKCEMCPVASLCSAFRQGIETELPPVDKVKSWLPLSHALVLVRRRGKYLMRQNPPGGWWEGLWDFPRVDVSVPAAALAIHPGHWATSAGHQLVQRAMQQELQLECRVTRHLQTMKHSVTRYRISLFCYAADLDGKLPQRQAAAGRWRWVDFDSELSVPLTSTAGKLRRSIMGGRFELDAIGPEP
jgi:A/G-specific adenine glycosylase